MRTLKLTLGIISAFFLFLLPSCHNFYKATAVTNSSSFRAAENIDSLKKQNRYFVLRNRTNSFYMNDIRLSPDQKELQCTLDTLSPEHKLHLYNGRKGKMQYKKYNQLDFPVLSEVHLYIQEDTILGLGKFTLPLDKIKKIEVIEKDKQRTTNSYIIGAVGYSLGAIAIVGIIIAALKSSCPFVSAYDGSQFALQGEIYGGSIYPQLARDDYMPLQMKPMQDGTLQVKISNELQEKQYTDMADLILITHDKKTKVLADEKGNLYQVSNPQKAVKATFSDGKDVMAAIERSNDNHLLYFDDTLGKNSGNHVEIKFRRPTDIKNGKLVLSIKNSYWLDYLYGQLAKGFGKYYNTYIKKQNTKTASELIKWTRDQQMPLEISLKTSAGWKHISYITTIGPLATREMVVPLDLNDVEDEFAEVRLSSGFMFWEIDYVAMDFTSENNMTKEILHPVNARDERGMDVLSHLQEPDGNYLEQLVPGTVTTIQYNYKPGTDKDKAYTYILHTRGYYTHVRNFTNRPDIGFLKQFKRPNAFPDFSLTLYKKFRNADLRALAKNQ